MAIRKTEGQRLSQRWGLIYTDKAKSVLNTWNAESDRVIQHGESTMNKQDGSL